MRRTTTPRLPVFIQQFENRLTDFNHIWQCKFNKNLKTHFNFGLNRKHQKISNNIGHFARSNRHFCISSVNRQTDYLHEQKHVLDKLTVSNRLFIAAKNVSNRPFTEAKNIPSTPYIGVKNVPGSLPTRKMFSRKSCTQNSHIWSKHNLPVRTGV